MSVFEQVESRPRGIKEEARLCVRFQGVVARDPGVPVKDERGPLPECLTLLPLGKL